MGSDSRIPATLPARYYCDIPHFNQELERFYFDRWVCAGREEQIRDCGRYFLAELAGESAIVTRDEAGRVRAFFNVCRHRGTRLCAEPAGGFAGRIQCPYHGWTYGLDGTLLGAPHMDQPAFRREDYPLRTVPAEVWEGHVFVHFGKPSGPVSAQLAPLTAKFAGWGMSALTLGKRIVYDVRANWKLIVLNYNECLHCPFLHPALNRLTDYLGADNEAPSPHYLGGAMGFQTGVETMSSDGKRRRDYLPGLSEARKRIVYYYSIYPNLLLSLHPDYMMTHTLWPKAVNRTEIVCEFHFHPTAMAKPDFQMDDAVSFWDQTNREDWAITEMAQLGIASRGYLPGPYSPREELLHAFDCVVASE